MKQTSTTELLNRILEDKVVLHTQDVVTLLGISRERVYELFRGEIPSFRVANRLMCRREDFEEWLEGRAAEERSLRRIC